MDLLKAVIVGAAVLTPIVAAAQDEALPILKSYSIIPEGINTAIVMDEEGTTLGIVQKVETDKSGTPRRIYVLMPGGRQLAIPASEASYDSMSHRVIADEAAIRTAEITAKSQG